jgi:hypothetical protein
MAIPSNRDVMLGRRDTAEALTEAGYPIAEATLATRASRGGGPPFRKFGRYPRYQWGHSLDWAQSRCTPLVRSTSELDGLRAPTVEWPSAEE